jgi:SAM-dependent methyltransferase
MKRKEAWEKIYEKKNRHGTEPCKFVIISLAWMKKIKGNKVLDLGCGEGNDSIFFAKNGYEVFSLDLSERAIKSFEENATQKNVQKLVHPILYDISKPLKFEDNMFDIVFAHLSLHYFDDEITTRIFAEIKRVLRTGGLLFIKARSTDDPTYGMGKKRGKDMFELDYTRHFFSKEYLTEKAKGFKILFLKQTKEKDDYAFRPVDKESVFWELVGEKK